MCIAATLRSARIVVVAVAASFVGACSSGPVEPSAPSTPSRARVGVAPERGKQTIADSMEVRASGAAEQEAVKGPTWPWY